MANDVFRAINAALVLSVEESESAEGSSANEIIGNYDLSSAVGRLHGVTVTVTSDVKPFYEIGRRYPTHLRAGAVQTTGTVERAHINAALLRLLLGGGAASPPKPDNFAQPAFNIIATLQESPSAPDVFTRLNIFGVKFSSWDFNLTIDDFVMESVTFQALRISFEEGS